MENKKKVIRIPDPSLVFNDAYLPFILGKPETLRPLIVMEGGRGSAKSREIAQFLIKASTENKLRILLIRKVARTIRDSQYRDLKDVVEDWGLSPEFEFLISPLSIRNTRVSEFLCHGLDKSTKIKSIANVDIVWVEEADELTHNDWIDLNLSIRGTRNSRMKQKILSFNRRAGNWTEEEFFFKNGQFKESKDIYHIHTTFQDNKFLDRAFLNELERLKEQDFELWQKNALGLPIKLRGIIFDKWDIIDDWPESGVRDIAYGLDFGMTDPTVLLKVGIGGKDNLDLYVDEKIYAYSKTNSDLIAELPRVIEDRQVEIFADAEAPDRIEEIYRQGWDIHPTDKEKGSVEFGIDVVKRYHVHILRHGTKTIKDFENYKWKVDMNGEPINGKPNHAYSHAPDALRGLVYTSTAFGKGYRNVTMKDLKNIDFPEMEAITIARNY